MTGPATLIPNHVQAERMVLGSVLGDPGVLSTMVGVLIPSDFYHHGHGVIFEAMLEMYQDGKPIDPLLLSEHLGANGKLQEVGGEDYLDDLVCQVTSPVGVEHYVRLVRGKAQLRRLTEVGLEIARSASAADAEWPHALNVAEADVFALGGRDQDEKRAGTPDLVEAVWTEIQERRAGKRPPPGISTGYHAIDDVIGGFRPGEMIVLAGRPSMGKSSLAYNIAHRIGVQRNTPVALFSLEVGAEQIVYHLLALSARVDLHDLKAGRIDDVGAKRIEKSYGEIKDAPVFIRDHAQLSPIALAHSVRKLVRAEEVELVIIDYLQLMELDTGRFESRQQEIAKLSRSLKRLAGELRIPILVLSQLSRKVEEREQHRPRMSDLRESGAIEQDADIVLLLHREGYYNPHLPDEELSKTDLIVAKHRGGRTGDVGLQFEKRYTRFDMLTV